MLLKRAKKRPNTFCVMRVTASGASARPFNSQADSAGDSVSEFTAEMSVEMAMVTANCL